MLMNTKRLVCFLLYNVLLPITLLAAVIFRYNGLSFVYACLLLVLPLLHTPSQKHMAGHTGRYLRAVLALSSIALIFQIIFQIFLAVYAKAHGEPYGAILPNCSQEEKILRQFGFQRVDEANVLNIARLLVPDVAMFTISLITFIVCWKLNPPLRPSDPQQPVRRSSLLSHKKVSYQQYIQDLGDVIAILFLGVAGIAHPSVISAVYFLSFLFIATWWACYRGLGQSYRRFRLVLLVFSGVHLLLLYLYQFQFFQEILDHEDFYARLFGLTGIIETSCSKAWEVEFYINPWPVYVSPAVILAFYWILAIEVRLWMSHISDVEQHPPGSDSASPSMLRAHMKRPKSRSRAVSEKQVEKDPAEETTPKMPDLTGGSIQTPPDLLYNLNVSESEAERLVENEDRPISYNSLEPVPSDSPSHQDSPPPANQATTDHTKPQRSIWGTIFFYLMRQSYIVTLVVMMLWSITYHSWLTFVFLLAACIIWMTPHSRTVCLHASPVIILYAHCLLIIGYVFGLSIEKELPGTETYEEIGLNRYPYPCLPLGVKVIYTFFFWLTLRQWRKETTLNKQLELEKGLELEARQDQGRQDVGHTDGKDSDTMTKIGKAVMSFLSKYWILVCSAMMLAMGIIDKPVLYRCVYMLLFLLYIIIFQLSYKVWRFVLYVFWWVVIIYSMLVLILIYTYQFNAFPSYWRNGTGLSDDILADIGLERYDVAGLVLKMLTPTVFLIMVILQVHYFHKPFMLMSDVKRYLLPGQEFELQLCDLPAKPKKIKKPAPPGEATDGEQTEGEGEDEGAEKKKKKRGLLSSMKHYSDTLWEKGSEWYIVLYRLLWRVLEIHIFKVVAFTITMVAVLHVSALSFIFIFFLMIFMPIGRLRVVASHLCQVWAALVILAKMAFQLRIAPTDYVYTNCTNMSSQHDNGSIFTNETVNNAVWVGLEKVPDVAYYVKDYIAIVLILAFEAVIKVHQRQFYLNPVEEKPKPGIVFPAVKRPHADTGIEGCLKFFANYFFYKFGLEMCFIMTVITICVRVDAYSVLYAIFLGVLLLLGRKGCSIIWPGYVITLAILLPLQYLSCLGFPPGLCWVYPWGEFSEFDKNLEMWLYLPDYSTEFAPNPYKLIADFFQLLLVCLQWQVFSMEHTSGADIPDGGDNSVLIENLKPEQENPTEDFISHKRSFLDVIKHGVFMYWFWVTLVIVFIAGTSRISIFCMGYLIGCFLLLWYGQDMFLKPLRQLLKMWNILLAYTFVVIFLKASMQVIGCVYFTQLYSNYCWVVQLFNIICLKAGVNIFNSGTKSYINYEDCTLPYDEAGMAWDAVVFIFLLIQIRIFRSYYFDHVVIELTAQNMLASRGAELINWRLIRDVRKRKEEEEAVLRNIKRKMERIKLRQQRISNKYTEHEDHYKTIRSGDYYMFEDDSDEDTISTDIHLGRDEDEDEGTEEEDRKPGPMELLTTALEQGTGAALDKAQVPTEGEHTGEEQPPGQSGTEDSATGPSTTQTGASGADGGRGGGGEDGAEEEEEETEATKWQKVKNYLKLGVAFFGSLLDSFINLLNDISRDYRLVARILEREKDQKKEEIKVRNHGGREMEDSTRADQSDEEAVRKPAEVRIEVEPSSARDNMTLVHLETLEQQAFDDLEYLERHSRIYRLLSALYTAIISRTELLCYFFMILNQMLSASLLSLPYPFAVFMWGMLSVPRPAKVFWITIITYTEAVVVLKYLFQFEFFPWNSEVLVHKDDVFWPPRILGIEKKDNYATVDLFLLLILFIHRSVLKGYGLWKDEQSLEEDFRKAEASERSHPGSPEDENVTLSTEAGAASDEKESSGETAAEEDEQGEEEGEEEEEMLDEEEEEETKKKKKKKRKRKPTMSWTKSVKEFYQNMTNPLYNATADAYAPMFACDFINFLIIMFGYWAFGPPTAASGDASSVATYISENRIPWPFLVMLIVQFVLIVVDRALYLKKDVFGKFAFQIILVLVLHIWVFFALPAITERKFVDNVPANLWYFVKCVYFGLSAYQIRCGYPTRILGNFLTKSYNYLNLFLFKGFLAIPFLLELRALMDWIWTDTTLALGSWLQMEDIYANIYVLKCWRTAEDKYPTPRGNPRRAIVKYGFGGLVLFLIIFIIWFPLVLFSFANTVYLPNPPIECRISVELAGYLPLYQMNAQPGQIYQFTDQDYRTLQDNYKMDNDVQAFLSIYEAKDTVRIEVLGTSTATWAISPPTMMDMVKDLNDTKKDIKIRLKVEMIRDPKKGQSANIISQWFEQPLNKSQRIELARIVNTSNTFGSLGSIYVLRLLPKFLQVPVNGRPSEVRALKEGSPLPTNISLTLKRGDVFNNESTSAEWWEVQEFVRGRYNLNSNDKLVRRDYLTLVAFSERVAPPGFDLLTGYGVIGLYISLVFVVGQFVRTFTSGMHRQIMFEELPYVDNILKLCLNVYLVRECREFMLEEDLYAKLIFLYRSPETMIKWTKLKES